MADRISNAVTTRLRTRSPIVAIASLICVAISGWAACSSGGDAQAGGNTPPPASTPQDLVACTGWHALCSASPDCRLRGNEADCDCLRVNEAHIVLTSEIRDAAIKSQTLTQCTNERPCGIDQAPVCKAIRDGQYRINGTAYRWVSTYSYRGWCSILAPGFTPCDPRAAGYRGDQYWAVCDAAPCTENPTPRDPARPLTCQCRVESTPFVGMAGSCTGKDGGIMSSFTVDGWDFERNTYRGVMPGYEYVQGACASLASDPPPPGK